MGAYSLMNCLFTVEGGHRAIVFNRIVGIKDHVWHLGGAPWTATEGMVVVLDLQRRHALDDPLV